MAAERAVLGSILLEGAAALTRIAASITPAAFYLERHRVIFEAMLALAERREPVDVLTLATELRKTDQIEAIGGDAVLAMLVEEAAILAHVDHYAAIVRDLFGLRMQIQVGTRLIERGFAGTDDPEATLEEAEQMLRDLRVRALGAGHGPRHVSEVLDTTIAQLRAGRPRGVVRMPYPTLNNLLAGGIQPGELVYFGAHAGFGKTACALQVTTFAAADGHAVLVISREMLNEALGRRLLSQHAGVSATAIRSATLSEGEWALIDRVLPKLRGLPVWMDDVAGSITQIEALVRLHKERHDLALLVVDYLQLLRAAQRMGDRRLEVEAISRRLKDIAHDYRLAVLCISGMSRREKTNPNRRPTMADLRETGALEHDADIILLGWRPSNDAQEAELIVAKGRGNQVGTVPLLYFGATLTFEERTDREPGADDVPEWVRG